MDKRADNRFLTALFCLLISLIANTAMAEENAVSVSADYRVQPGDVLFVSVWNEEQLQREVVVRPDGGISFPLIGDLQVTDKSVAQIKAEITQRLTRYIPEAAVNVAVHKVVGNKIFVLGQVKRPGEFILTAGTDVMQALSMAGGLTAFADRDGIKIIRRNKSTNTQQSIPFNYKKILKGKGLEQNILLKSGDTVVVP